MHGILASVDVIHLAVPAMEEIKVAQNFFDVFPAKLFRMLLDRETDYFIDLAPSTTPILKAPYCMAFAELKELKAQLKDLQNKGFIRSTSVSPWRALVLFIKKKDSSICLCIPNSLWSL